MREQVPNVEQNFLVAGDAEFFVQVINFAGRFFDKFLADAKRNDRYLGFVHLVETQQVALCAFGNCNNLVGAFTYKPKDEFKVKVDELERQKFGID